MTGPGPSAGEGAPFDPERYLSGLGPIGWKFGLERMRRLCAELDDPQDSFTSLHVVGTNGKSSVSRMTAALLSIRERRTGLCTSPHVLRWSQRIEIDGREIDPRAFALAVDQVKSAIEALGLDHGEETVTQFEAQVATAFTAFRDAGANYGVIEAGLGGRLDATNVIRSAATALTSVGLDHTDYLGATEAEIAAEKLAVLEPGTKLVVGELEPEILELARAAAAERDCELVEPGPLASGIVGGLPAPYLRRNARVAIALARTVEPGLSEDEIVGALAGLQFPGRAEVLEGSPPLIADAAHNPQGAEALAEALPTLLGGRPGVGLISVLADKDSTGIAEALAPELGHVVCTAIEPDGGVGRPGARAADPRDLARAFRAAGCRAEPVADPAVALARAEAEALRRGGVVVCAGSHYLLSTVWTARNAQNFSR